MKVSNNIKKKFNLANVINNNMKARTSGTNAISSNMKIINNMKK
jgi:hypothetical protein